MFPDPHFWIEINPCAFSVLIALTTEDLLMDKVCIRTVIGQIIVLCSSIFKTK